MKTVNVVLAAISMIYYTFLWAYVIQLDMRVWWDGVLVFWVGIIICLHAGLIIIPFILPERK